MSPLLITDTQMLQWVAAFFWPFVRVGGMLMTAPIFGSKATSVRVRLITSLILTVVIAPLVPVPPMPEMFSSAWFLTLGTQLAIGVIMGFVLQMVFESVVMAGELIALGMGLSFAQLADPLRGVSTGVLGQFFLLLATLLFLAMDGHLAIVTALVESFRMMPVGTLTLGLDSLLLIVEFGGRMYLSALQIALPAVISLLLVNMAFGVISRAAPTLNPIAVGFPITLTLGYLVLQFTLEPLADGFGAMLERGWALISTILGG